MTTLQDYLENPVWRAQHDRALQGAPNDGYYKRWIQGSVGMMEPMHIYSNEFSHLYMKHGQNSLLPYRGNVKKFTPSVTDGLRRQVVQCSRDTLNPVGCQRAAINQAFSVDAQDSQYGRTPHPYDSNYRSGLAMGMPDISPNSHRYNN